MKIQSQFRKVKTPKIFCSSSVSFTFWLLYLAFGILHLILSWPHLFAYYNLHKTEWQFRLYLFLYAKQVWKKDPIKNHLVQKRCRLNNISTNCNLCFHSKCCSILHFFYYFQLVCNIWKEINMGKPSNCAEMVAWSERRSINFFFFLLKDECGDGLVSVAFC